MQYTSRLKHLVVFVLYPFLASFLSFYLNLNTFESILVFLLIPSLHLSFLLRHSIVKSATFSLLVSTFLFIPIDYVAHATKQWLVPDTIFPFRLFFFVPIEDILWAFLLGYFIIMFYEYFLDGHRDRKMWRPRMKYLGAVFVLVFLIFLLLFFTLPHLLQIPFFYLWMGIIVVLIPVIVELFRRPLLSGKLCLAGAYFFVLSLIYEITALKLGWWSFPSSQFIGWIEVLDVRFPFEEFFFWLMLTAIAALAYYEFADDDEK